MTQFIIIDLFLDCNAVEQLIIHLTANNQYKTHYLSNHCLSKIFLKYYCYQLQHMVKLI